VKDRVSHLGFDAIMNREREFTINLHPQPEGGYTVLVPALPEVVTEGDTREEALANAREAIEAVLELYREEGWEIPEDVKTEIGRLTIAA
jgi:antitoxin HicB